MLFLMNDRVLDLADCVVSPDHLSHRFAALSLAAVSRMGRELYAEAPLLHHTHPERARRLASLIMAKSPLVNAALFVCPQQGCLPNDVTVQYTNLTPASLDRLLAVQTTGQLTTLAADRQVWKRLAA